MKAPPVSNASPLIALQQIGHLDLLHELFDRVLLDERQARRLAAILGLEVTGTLGLLLASKRRGLIQAIKPLLEALIRYEFRISESLLEQVLRSAGE